MVEDWQTGGFGLYLHWPFCEAKCPYCDFNSHVAREIDHARWRAAYVQEIRRYAAALPGRVLNSVFFGGGTPSLMEPETVAVILDEARRAWPTANDLEVTLEANPSSVEAGRFRAYGEAGVSRVSLGVQALNDTDLRQLGRIHSMAEAEQAIDIARKYFSRVSFDLIYARQEQDLASWRDELKRALDMAVDHLSLYQLTIEGGTAFGDRYASGKLRGLPGDDLAADMYHATQEICNAAGMGAYEVSNHAKPGSESRHNLIYWRYGDYIGIGPGAHGRVTRAGQRYATETWLQPNLWLKEAESGQTERVVTPLSPETQAGEYLLMGLRIREGIDMNRFATLNGTPLNEDRLQHLEEIGMLERRGTRLMATRQGIAVLNAILTQLLPD
ncbi:oxygen-independent coproporphyrinogen-III oxidase 1 [Roseovarius sp. A-2]|uniref:radical SAM family heme chaperone HemW n=1 Tax=Roseovarius sp. A-2 TaxID=1570360 RepID=UPI0009B513C5|nr:radical SAM family heme chaperone HemW [Roseovarius sp. A-2]GAW36335.1 oxygen-independent coproporphyrinogen-III oxidase 1 [Roseovarius sp. A-2]